MTGDQNNFHTIYSELLSAFHYHCFNVYVTQTDWINWFRLFFHLHTNPPTYKRRETEGGVRQRNKIEVTEAEMVVTLQSDRAETEPELAVKPKPKKEGSVFPAKRKLVKTMVFNSVLHLFVSVCSSAGRGAAKPKTPNGKKFKQIVPTMCNASPVTTNKSGTPVYGEVLRSRINGAPAYINIM